MNYYQSHELLSNNLTRRDVTVRDKVRVVKAIIKFPFMCRRVCSVGFGLVLKVSSMQVNMMYYNSLVVRDPRIWLLRVNMLLVVSDCFYEEEQVPKTEVSAGSSGIDSGKHKPKRKWALLVGGGRTKPSSNAKGSKSNVFTKEATTSEEDATGSLQNRWCTGLPRLPLPATISKETMVSSSEVLL